jgi:hypothetical protein
MCLRRLDLFPADTSNTTTSRFIVWTAPLSPGVNMGLLNTAELAIGHVKALTTAPNLCDILMARLDLLCVIPLGQLATHQWALAFLLSVIQQQPIPHTYWFFLGRRQP